MQEKSGAWIASIPTPMASHENPSVPIGFFDGNDSA